MSSPLQADSDRPLNPGESDQFGFAGIAKRLAPALLEALNGEGMVVGLEGPWGSGKTTLLNFLKSELISKKGDDVELLFLAPWLSGDVSNLVDSLIQPLAEVLERLETKKMDEKRSWLRRKAKKSKSSLARILRIYGAKTGRTLAPIARFAEYFVPGAKIAAEGLEIGSDYLGRALRHPTTAEMKAQLSESIRKLEIKFVVVLDDLDRLEPAHALEVVRLVRSVADFPNIMYLMCYDREILSHALARSLDLSDGDLFLQKIVQLSFAMPMPEPFDLRASFLRGAIAIYESLNGSPIDNNLMDDLRAAVDRQGSALRTPREVKLALNSVRLIYPTVCHDTYFPDVCRILLIKTLHVKLYRWLEEYLAVRSVLVAGDGSVGEDQRTEYGARLAELLPAKDSQSSRSIWSLRSFIPGVAGVEVDKEKVFAECTEKEISSAIDLRRIGSPIHYRYYFALSAPKSVMSEQEFGELVDLARSDVSTLSQRLVKLSGERRYSARSWFEHVLDRLDAAQIEKLDSAALAGLIISVADAMDEVLKTDEDERQVPVSIDRKACRVVESCLMRLRASNLERFCAASQYLAEACDSPFWAVSSFFREQLWNHGLVGNRKKPPELWIFSEEELERLLIAVRTVARSPRAKNRVLEMPRIAGYLFAWRELGGDSEVRHWVEKSTQGDEEFLSILGKLRTWAISDRVYYPLHRETVESFTDFDAVVTRLNDLKDSEAFGATAKDLLRAIQVAKS